MVAILRRYLSALHYIDHGRSSFKNAKLALTSMKDKTAKSKLDLIITEADEAFDLIEKRLRIIMPQVDMFLSIDFDEIDVETL